MTTTTLNSFNTGSTSFVQRVLATDDNWAPLALRVGGVTINQPA